MIVSYMCGISIHWHLIWVANKCLHLLWATTITGVYHLGRIDSQFYQQSLLGPDTALFIALFCRLCHVTDIVAPSHF